MTLAGLHCEDDEYAGHDPCAVVVLEFKPQLHGEVVRVQGVYGGYWDQYLGLNMAD